MARTPLPDRPSTRIEVALGRGLAMSVHPHLAWRLLPASRRALLVFGYFAVGYVTVLAALQFARIPL
jgi:hypothetical protein